MRAQTRFDMRKWNPCGEGGQRGPDSTRRVTLDDQQVRSVSQKFKHGSSDGPHMIVRVLLSCAV